MAAEDSHRRAAFLRQYRWGLAFGVAIALTFLMLPLRPIHARLAYDLVPAIALVAVWIGAGVLMGVVARYWASRADLPMARTESRR